MNEELALQTGHITADEAALCRLLAANVREFGRLFVDAKTLEDVRWGTGAFAALSYEECLQKICDCYDWTFINHSYEDREYPEHIHPLFQIWASKSIPENKH